MAKKTLNKEYLESRFKTLQKQREKVIGILNQYNTLYTKIEGALEVTDDMLKEFQEEKVEETKKE